MIDRQTERKEEKQGKSKREKGERQKEKQRNKTLISNNNKQRQKPCEGADWAFHLATEEVSQ